MPIAIEISYPASLTHDDFLVLKNKEDALKRNLVRLTLSSLEKYEWISEGPGYTLRCARNQAVVFTEKPEEIKRMQPDDFIRAIEFKLFKTKR